MKLTQDMKKLIDVLEEMDWNVDVEEANENQTVLRIGKYSPAGQDFGVSVTAANNDVQEFINDLYVTYRNYDASLEAYLWLDDTGHGRNGAPYEMIDVYNDMKWCEQELGSLWEKLDCYSWEE